MAIVTTQDKLLNRVSQCYDTGASDTAGTWTVSIPNITALTEGLTIKIRLKTSYNNTTNTLNLNGLGAKTIYWRYGSKLTSHYAKESILALTYSENAISSGNDKTGWIIENIYDSTNTYQLRKYYSRYKAKSALYRYMICFINSSDELIPANGVSNSTATTKTLTTESFMLSKGIYYYNSTTTISAGSYTGNATLYQQLGLLDLRYSFNTGTTLTANKPVYLVVTPQTDGQVKLASTPIVQSLPTTTTNDLYVFLGIAYDTYRIELTIDHPIYIYRNGYCESLDMSHDRAIKNIPDFEYVGSWHEGQIMVASGQGSITASNVDITDITDDIIALKTDSHTHTNKSILDNITEAFTTALKTKLDGIEAATSSSLGLVKLGSDTVQSTTANSVTSTSSRTYAVQKNSNGQLVVNVPWTTSSASIPSELAKIVNSGTNNIQIERYGSSSYGMRIQTGKVSVNKAETINQNVSFPSSTLFSNTPVVILTPVINNTADTRQIDTELTSVSKTGFHFSCALGNTSYKITEVHYIAIQLI